VSGETGAGAPGAGASPARGEETIATEVPALLAGVRADRAVAMVADVSRAAATQLIAEGRVLVDGSPVSVGREMLRQGATLTIRLPEDRQPGVAAEPGVRFEVVFADDAVVVVDKPAGLVVHPGAGHDEGTLVGGLLSRFPDLAELVAAGVCPPDRPGIVHRLDKGTSGLLAVARTEDAYRELVDQLATRTMERRYLALVAGEVADDRGEVEAPIGRSTRTPTKMAVTASG
jgi:23S rRNA pseudouridine1911/1915/1917 synthase